MVSGLKFMVLILGFMVLGLSVEFRVSGLGRARANRRRGDEEEPQGFAVEDL